MSKRIVVAAAAFCIAMTVLRVLYLRRGEIVVDEFQHLHAAYLVAGGQTPYVDFFEHHTPLFYYVAAPLLRASALDFDTILSMRYLSFGAGLLTVLIASWWANRLRGRAAGVLVGVLMLGDLFLFSRGTLLFLDVFACPFLMVSAILLVPWCDLAGRAASAGRVQPLPAAGGTGPTAGSRVQSLPAAGGTGPTIWAAFASGLAMGVAILFTQKAVMAGFAVLAVLIRRLLKSPRKAILGGLCFAAGGLTAALLLPVTLGFDALGAFFHDNVVMNMAWKARHFPVREMAALAGTNGAIYLLAVVGLAARLHGLWQRRFRALPKDVPALFLMSLAMGVLLLPVVWSEYFILVVPFAIVVAGLFLCDLARVPRLRRSRGTPTRSWLIVLVAACTAVSLVDLVGRWLVHDHPLSTAAFVAVLVVWGMIGNDLCFGITRLSVDQTLSPQARGVMLKHNLQIAAIAFLLTLPVVEQVDFLWQQPNDAQRARVEFVLASTSPTDAVFDGYSGYGVFRPHAYKYWFLHEEVQAMLSRDELVHGVIDAIERCRAPIAIRDAWTKQLPDEVQRYFAEKYAPTQFPEILTRRPR